MTLRPGAKLSALGILNCKALWKGGQALHKAHRSCCGSGKQENGKWLMQTGKLGVCSYLCFGSWSQEILGKGFIRTVMHKPVSFHYASHRKVGLIQKGRGDPMKGWQEDTGSLQGGRARGGGHCILTQATAGTPQPVWRWPVTRSSGLWLGRDGEEGSWGDWGCGWHVLPRERIQQWDGSAVPSCSLA